MNRFEIVGVVSTPDLHSEAIIANACAAGEVRSSRWYSDRDNAQRAAARAQRYLDSYDVTHIRIEVREHSDACMHRASVIPPNGLGAYCRDCGETLA